MEVNFCGNKSIYFLFYENKLIAKCIFKNQQGRVESAFTNMPKVEHCFFCAQKSLSSPFKLVCLMLTILSDLKIGLACMHIHIYACILFFLLTTQYSDISVFSCRLSYLSPILGLIYNQTISLSYLMNIIFTTVSFIILNVSGCS